jgi:hypothetical protein
MSKLTLSVDQAVVARAKRLAAARGTSVSQLVERYLSLLSRPEEPQPAPVLQALRGILKEGSREDYRRHLERKYR